MYQCKRCGYLSKRKGNLSNHLKRKNICEPIISNALRSELLKELVCDNRRKKCKIGLSNTTSPKCNPNVTRTSPGCHPETWRTRPFPSLRGSWAGR